VMYLDRPSVLSAATEGDAFGVSATLYQTRYYRGTGPDAKTRIYRHLAVLMKHLTAICRALREPMPDGKLPPPQTLKRGSSGQEVREAQRLLGLVADGLFGPIMQEAVEQFQRDNGLKADGILGPLTWDKLLESAPPAPDQYDEGFEKLDAALKVATETSALLRSLR